MAVFERSIEYFQMSRPLDFDYGESKPFDVSWPLDFKLFPLCQSYKIYNIMSLYFQFTTDKTDKMNKINGQ